MDPSRQRADSVAGVLIGLAVRPLSPRRLHEPLGLAIRLWTVGSHDAMLDVQLSTGLLEVLRPERRLTVKPRAAA
jgi:hypothetical protein